MAGRARVYALLAALFGAFAVWGSLFPFTFHRLAPELAMARLWSAWQIPVAAWSLTDLCSNLLLFIPVGFCVAAVLETARERPLGAMTALVTCVGVIVFSFTLEFAQAFVWWRTPSIVDVLAETAGAAVGLAGWRTARGACDRLVDSARRMWVRATGSEQALGLYSIGFAALWLFPFDFTIRPVEIFDKYHHQRLLMPFTPSPDAALPMALAASALIAMPLGAAAVLCGTGGGRRDAITSVSLVGLWLIALTCLQVLVFSRTTDGTEFVAAGAGALVGTAATAIAVRSIPAAVDRKPSERKVR